MTAKQGKNGLTRGELIAVSIFAALFGLYLLNILIGKANIVFGWNIFHVGSIGEFLMLLVASVAFIVAALHQETVRNLNQTPGKE